MLRFRSGHLKQSSGRRRENSPGIEIEFGGFASWLIQKTRTCKEVICAQKSVTFNLLPIPHTLKHPVSNTELSGSRELSWVTQRLRHVRGGMCKRMSSIGMDVQNIWETVRCPQKETQITEPCKMIGGVELPFELDFQKLCPIKADKFSSPTCKEVYTSASKRCLLTRVDECNVSVDKSPGNGFGFRLRVVPKSWGSIIRWHNLNYISRSKRHWTKRINVLPWIFLSFIYHPACISSLERNKNKYPALCFTTVMLLNPVKSMHD